MLISRCCLPPPFPPDSMLGTTEPKKTRSVFYFGGPVALHEDASFNIEPGGGRGAQQVNFLQGVFYFANAGTLVNVFSNLYTLAEHMNWYTGGRPC